MSQIKDTVYMLIKKKSKKVLCLCLSICRITESASSLAGS